MKTNSMTVFYSTDKEENRAVLRFLALFCLLIVGVRCVATGPTRALTEKERAIKVMPAAQDVSQQLSDRCKSIGKVESFNHMDNAKIRAGELGANVVQNIYATNYNGYLQYDVRFWRCKQ